MGLFETDMNGRSEEAYRDNLRWFPKLADDIRHHGLGLAGEAGEVANEIKKYDRGSQELDKLRERVGGELADVLVYVFSIAAILEIDLEEAYDKKRKFNEERFGKKETVNG